MKKDMTHWYQPKEKAKEYLRHRRERRHGGEKEEWYGKWPFFDWTQDTFYTRNFFDFLIVPQNHALVKLNLGRVGEVIREDKHGGIIYDDRTSEEKLLGEPPKIKGEARRYRDFPYGGTFGPGLHFALTLMGLSEIAVVYTGQRELHLENSNVLTRDPIQMDKVDALLTYHVYDPLLAMTGTERGESFEDLTKLFGEARLTDTINDSSLDQILRAKGTQTNLAYNYDDAGNLEKDSEGNPIIYNPLELRRIGVKIDGLRVTEYKLPKNVEELFSARVEASIAAEAAQFHRKAGEVYDASDPSRGAREVLWTQSASQKDSNVSYDVHTGKVADSIREFANALANLLNKKS